MVPMNSGIPVPKHPAEIVVQDFGPHLNKQEGTPLRPLPLLPLGHALAADLIDRRFDEG